MTAHNLAYHRYCFGRQRRGPTVKLLPMLLVPPEGTPDPVDAPLVMIGWPASIFVALVQANGSMRISMLVDCSSSV